MKYPRREFFDNSHVDVLRGSDREGGGQGRGRPGAKEMANPEVRISGGCAAVPAIRPAYGGSTPESAAHPGGVPKETSRIRENPAPRQGCPSKSRSATAGRDSATAGGGSLAWQARESGSFSGRRFPVPDGRTKLCARPPARRSSRCACGPWAGRGHPR